MIYLCTHFYDTLRMKKQDPDLLDNAVLSGFVSMKYLPRWIVLSMDVILSIIAFLIAVYVAGKIKIEPSASVSLNQIQRMIVLVSFQVVLFGLFHTYSGVLRYASFVDVTKIFFAIVLNVFVIGLINLVMTSLSKGVLIFYTELIVYCHFCSYY